MSVHDANYNEVKRLLGIPEDEPIFILRAQDRFAPQTVEGYAQDVFTCQRKRFQFEEDDVSKAQFLKARAWRQRVDAAADEMYDWQQENEDRVKIPD